MRHTQSGTRWTDYLDEFGAALVHHAGYSTKRLPRDANPVAEVLRDPDLSAALETLPGFSRAAVCRAAVVCQMAIFDEQGGPEGDHELKALRRHWYAYFKAEIAQPLADLLGDYEINSQGVREYNDRLWNGRQSDAYGGLVDQGLTYKDLWVEDASRMIERFYDRLFQGLNLVLCVEKDSLFQDFRTAAQATGAALLVSGKGKMGRAATEKALRSAFTLTENGRMPYVTRERPILCLTISDYDCDGESVIAPTFAEQIRRYTPHVIDVRVGVEPESFAETRDDGSKMLATAAPKWARAAYSVKVSNKGYQTWADEHALYTATCEQCGESWIVIGSGPRYEFATAPFALAGQHTCKACGHVHDELDLSDSMPKGFEVESLPTRWYYKLIAEAVLRALPFETIVSALRDECKPDSGRAADELVDDVLDENDDYAALKAEFERLQELKEQFEADVRTAILRIAESHRDDDKYRELEDDPEKDDFIAHVQSAQGWAGPWRPFSVDVRTDELVDDLRDELADELAELKEQKINWN